MQSLCSQGAPHSVATRTATGCCLSLPSDWQDTARFSLAQGNDATVLSVVGVKRRTVSQGHALNVTSRCYAEGIPCCRAIKRRVLKHFLSQLFHLVLPCPHSLLKLLEWVFLDRPRSMPSSSCWCQRLASSLQSTPSSSGTCGETFSSFSGKRDHQWVDADGFSLRS